MKWTQLALFALVVFSAFRCAGKNEDEMVTHHDEIVAKALKDVPLLHAFKERFPESKHFISYITGEDGPPTWNSATPLFGRYVFWMTIPLSINKRNFKVHLDGAPSFYLHEVRTITTLPDGRQSIYYDTDSPTFDAKMSKKLQASDWNFEALGIKLKKNQPVKGFSDYSTY